MRTADLVIDDERSSVDACDVSYSDFSRIFQCPCCKQSLHLRAGFYRKGGWVDPAFVHSKGNPEDCKERAKRNEPNTDDDVLSIISMGQSSKKIEEAFLNCFQYSFQDGVGARAYIDDCHNVPRYDYRHGSSRIWSHYTLPKKYIKKIIDFNSRPNEVHEDPNLFVKASLKVLEDKRSRVFIEKSTSDFQSTFSNKKGSIYLREKSRAVQIKMRKLVDQHCIQLINVINYLCFGASPKLRKDVIKLLIWLDYNGLPVSPTKIETQTDRKARRRSLKYEAETSTDFSVFRLMRDSPDTYYSRLEGEMEIQFEQDRKSQINRIQQFTSRFLSLISRDELVVDTAFTDFYNQKETPGSKFIRFVLERLMCSIRIVNWDKLPEFYVHGGPTLHPWEFQVFVMKE